MLFILLSLIACRTADITVPTDSSVLTEIPQGEFEGDVAGECSDGADNDRDGSFDCDDPECWGSTDCSTDTGTMPDGDDTGVTGTDDTGGVTDTNQDDTAATEVGPACADGTVELDMGDGAFCEYPEAGDNTNDPTFPVREAPAACGEGWHVCSESEWFERNDGCDSTFAFQGTLDAPWDGGNSCQVVDDTSYASCGADLTRSSYSGTCHGDPSGGEWGTGARSGVTYSGTFGVMCCL